MSWSLLISLVSTVSSLSLPTNYTPSKLHSVLSHSHLKIFARIVPSAGMLLPSFWISWLFFVQFSWNVITSTSHSFNTQYYSIRQVPPLSCLSLYTSHIELCLVSQQALTQEINESLHYFCTTSGNSIRNKRILHDTTVT